MKKISRFEMTVNGQRGTPNRGFQPVGSPLGRTVNWFTRTIELLQRRNQRLEESLRLYRIAFWGLAAVLIAFVIGAVMEVWG